MTTNTYMKDLAANLCQRRNRVGLTRTKLAAIAHVSPTTIANFEDGYVPQRSPSLERICLALDERERDLGLLANN